MRERIGLNPSGGEIYSGRPDEHRQNDQTASELSRLMSA